MLGIQHVAGFGSVDQTRGVPRDESQPRGGEACLTIQTCLAIQDRISAAASNDGVIADDIIATM